MSLHQLLDQLGKRNKKVATKHAFAGAREFIVAWLGLRVCASASLLGRQCHCSSPRVWHAEVLWPGMHRNLCVTLPQPYQFRGQRYSCTLGTGIALA
jgi:hypothetical protein